METEVQYALRFQQLTAFFFKQLRNLAWLHGFKDPMSGVRVLMSHGGYSVGLYRVSVEPHCIRQEIVELPISHRDALQKRIEQHGAELRVLGL